MSFAAPFVMVVTAACGGSGSKTPPIHPNPPGPDPKTQNACSADVKPDGACTADEKCSVPSADGCGLNGYQCRDGKWSEMMTACNPPPPSN